VTAQLRTVAEGVARRTSRRGLFSRGAEVAFGALIGATAGTLTRGGGASAGAITYCAFPNAQPCPCGACQSNGVCAKPCVILTFIYPAGCWIADSVTCCDCDCLAIGVGGCGCGSDYPNDSMNCPNGNATGG
jgi:hypothetical protein